MIVVFMLTGFIALAVIAVLVGIIDATGAPARRLLAAERRERWETQHTDTKRGGNSVPDPDLRD